jgi:hypothetical protein
MLFGEMIAVYSRNLAKPFCKTKPNTSPLQRLMLFMEIVAVYCRNLMNPHEYSVWTKGRDKFNVNVGGTYSNHWVLKGLPPI